MEKQLPLGERSIRQIYLEGSETITYKIPIYQRNYAWEEEQISALIKDVYDSYHKDAQSTYFIGTLVTYKRGDNEYEVIDGQQRLTTIYIILTALKEHLKNKLTYSARKVSASTIENLKDYPNLGDEVDCGISNGYNYADKALEDIVDSFEHDRFKKYFLDNVHIIHYKVPKDVDLNHYFEVMNSRGEQLEKHEIVKSRLSQALCDKTERATFCHIWDACSEMNIYIQQALPDKEVDLFGNNINSFIVNEFRDIPVHTDTEKPDTIMSLLSQTSGKNEDTSKKERNDKFQPIIDFPNFLLIVLKLTLMRSKNFIPTDFILDDKELLIEFDKAMVNVDKAEFARVFAFNLLKAKYLLDNYIVHHTLSDEETSGDNPWKLQYYFKESNKRYPKNIADKEQDELVQLLSMFEVAFTPKQRKNYLLYCMLYLFENHKEGTEKYLLFLRNLANKYFYDVYLDSERLTERHQPRPNAFDEALLKDNVMNLDSIGKVGVDYKARFEEIYAQGRSDIPLYVFNYTDYILWKKYDDELRGNKFKPESNEMKEFFEELGCSYFELDVFKNFYFSRTRKSLEHYYPQAMADGNPVTPKDINCFGNFAIIGAQMNSSGNSWNPHAKLEHYCDGKTNPVSVASLKFKIMMQMCDDNYLYRNKDNAWNVEDMQVHQTHILNIIFKRQTTP